MNRWMCGISMKDRRTSEEFRSLVGVEPITGVILSYCKICRTILTLKLWNYFKGLDGILICYFQLWVGYLL